MSSEILRRAASLMRERAEAATPGPWIRDGAYRDGDLYVCDEASGEMCWTPDTYMQHRAEADAAHIAGMHPAVALAVAHWLDHEAATIGRWDEGTPGRQTLALAVARAYLGESA